MAAGPCLDAVMDVRPLTMISRLLQVTINIKQRLGDADITKDDDNDDYDDNNDDVNDDDDSSKER